MGGKGFPAPQPHPLFPLPPAAAAAAAASLGGLMSPRNSLPGLPSLGVGGLLSPQQFLAKRPSLQETPSEVSAILCVFLFLLLNREGGKTMKLVIIALKDRHLPFMKFHQIQM